MFVVMNRFFVDPAYAEQFETRVKNRPQRVDDRPGFVNIQILKPAQPEAPFIVTTWWESQAHFEAWVNNQEFTEKHAGRRTLPPEAFTQPNQVETFNLLPLD